jgi:hypothetical protein
LDSELVRVDSQQPSEVVADGRFLEGIANTEENRKFFFGPLNAKFPSGNRAEFLWLAMIATLQRAGLYYVLPSGVGGVFYGARSVGGNTVPQEDSRYSLVVPPEASRGSQSGDAVLLRIRDDAVLTWSTHHGIIKAMPIVLSPDDPSTVRDRISKYEKTFFDEDYRYHFIFNVANGQTLVVDKQSPLAADWFQFESAARPQESGPGLKLILKMTLTPKATTFLFEQPDPRTRPIVNVISNEGLGAGDLSPSMFVSTRSGTTLQPK